jgi:FkbM family methyltransferase
MQVSKAIHVLDRPGGRTLLAFVATVTMTVRERRRCYARYHDQMWIHVHRGRSIVESQVMISPPETLDAAVEELNFHDYRPRAGDVVVDAGAGVGRETALLSTLVGPTGRVLSLEAHPATRAMLDEMVRRNGLSNVTTFGIALSGSDGTLVISDDMDLHEANRVASDGPGIEVEAQSLATFLDQNGIDHVDYLKANIEGAELASIEAFADRLEQIDHLCVSCHDFVADRTGDESFRTMRRVREILEDAGFEVNRRDEEDRVAVRCYLYAKNKRTTA